VSANETIIPPSSISSVANEPLSWGPSAVAQGPGSRSSTPSGSTSVGGALQDSGVTGSRAQVGADVHVLVCPSVCITVC